MSKYIYRLGRILFGTRASQIAEFALIVPVLVTLFIAIFWFARVFNIYATINHAAREGARAAAAQTCGACPGSINGPGPNSALTADQVASIVKQSLLASHIDPTQATSTTQPFLVCGGTATAACNMPGPGNPQMCVYFNVQLDKSPPNPISPTCGVAVSFQYPYQFYLPFTSLNQQQIKIPATVQMQGEY